MFTYCLAAVLHPLKEEGRPSQVEETAQLRPLCAVISELLVIFRWRRPSIGGADFQQPYRINDVRQRNREEDVVLLERCGIR